MGEGQKGVSSFLCSRPQRQVQRTVEGGIDVQAHQAAGREQGEIDSGSPQEGSRPSLVSPEQVEPRRQQGQGQQVQDYGQQEEQGRIDQGGTPLETAQAVEYVQRRSQGDQGVALAVAEEELRGTQGDQEGEDRRALQDAGAQPGSRVPQDEEDEDRERVIVELVDSPQTSRIVPPQKMQGAVQNGGKND